MALHIICRTRRDVTPFTEHFTAKDVTPEHVARQLAQYMSNNWNPVLEWVTVPIDYEIKTEPYEGISPVTRIFE